MTALKKINITSQKYVIVAIGKNRNPPCENILSLAKTYNKLIVFKPNKKWVRLMIKNNKSKSRNNKNTAFTALFILIVLFITNENKLHINVKIKYNPASTENRLSRDKISMNFFESIFFNLYKKNIPNIIGNHLSTYWGDCSSIPNKE